MWYQTKKCRKCKESLDIAEFPSMNLWKYWVWSTCIKCIAEKAWNSNINSVPLNRSQKPINKVSKTNKNTPAKFTREIKDEILERDRVCIISWKKIEQYHHAFFWAHDANYWPNRNNADQWVWLHSEPHRIIHHPSPEETKKSKTYRARCIEHLIKLQK